MSRIHSDVDANPDPITIPADDRAWSELSLLFEEAYGPEDARLWRAFHGQPPFCQRDWCRVIRRDGRIASHICFVPRPMRIGAAVIRAGAIGYVATHPDYGGRGLASQLMNYWTAEATAQGHHLAYIHGIPDFYERFGYRHALPADGRDPPMWIDVANVSAAPTSLTVRGYRPGDLPALARLYAQDNRQRSGTLVRSVAYWQWLLEGLAAFGAIGAEGIRVAQRPDGQLVGYAMIFPADLGRFSLGEIAAQGEEAMTALLNELGRLAREVGHDRLHLRLPLDHPFAAFCVARGAQVVGYSDGVYARLLDVTGLFQALGPELEARLARSALRGWTGTLRLETDVGTVTLPFVNGSLRSGNQPAPLRVVQLPQSWLARLVTGYCDVAALHRRRGIVLEREDWPLLKALFPRGCSYIWAADGNY